MRRSTVRQLDAKLRRVFRMPDSERKVRALIRVADEIASESARSLADARRFLARSVRP